jgi:hypothetical protein
MKEFAMALWAMTATHHEWPKPPDAAVTVQPSRNQALRVNDEEHAELKAALKKMELKADCR